MSGGLLRITAAGIVVLSTVSCSAADPDQTGEREPTAGPSTTTTETPPTTTAGANEGAPATDMSTTTIAIWPESEPVDVEEGEPPPDQGTSTTSIADAADEGTSTIPPRSTVEASGGPWQIAVADLAGRLGVDASLISVVSIEDVVWPDGSLGCPQPGTQYKQESVLGTRILLRAAASTYEYHSGGAREVVYCPNPASDAGG